MLLTLDVLDQCYRLDGKLVAIGVIDLLPHCVSSVYFLYHESFHVHNPGKLGALREIALAAEQGYQWWYSGYYIHTCSKMKYKIAYSPTYILDPESYNWLLLDEELLARFNKRGYLDIPPPEGTDVQESSRTEQSTSDADKSATSPVSDGALFTSRMPGMMSREQIDSVDLDHVVTRINRGYFHAEDLFEWQDESITDVATPKSVVAGLAALLGPDLLKLTCLDFRRV